MKNLKCTIDLLFILLSVIGFVASIYFLVQTDHIPGGSTNFLGAFIRITCVVGLPALFLVFIVVFSTLLDEHSK